MPATVSRMYVHEPYLYIRTHVYCVLNPATSSWTARGDCFFRPLGNKFRFVPRRGEREAHGAASRETRCHAAMCPWIPLALWLQRSHNHHDDNYVGKCGYKGAIRWKNKREREREREREGKRSGDRHRFHRWPAASSFDPSLIILVSTELIATHAAFPFDRSCFFIPLPNNRSRFFLLSLSHLLSRSCLASTRLPTSHQVRSIIVTKV